MEREDVIVVGAGAIGTSVAYHLARDGRSVLVLEKEARPGEHQSTRNSGVVHAGYNLKPGSEKARFCREGSKRLRAYCLEKRIPLDVGGILVVARDEHEMATLRELDARARANGTDARILDETGLRAVEPHAAGIGALHAREGASFDARAYVDALARDAMAIGARFEHGARVLSIEEDGVRTAQGKRASRVVVNAAGLFADKLARAHDMRIVPFRGYYAELTPAAAPLVRSHIYAAPDLSFPFLGVHLSRRTDGRVIVGPGAMLAFGREAYSFASFRGGGLGATLSWPGFWRMMTQPRFRSLIRSEVAKSLRIKAIWREAARLVPELKPDGLVRSFAGNRAQQVSRDGKLVDDIVVRETEHAVHVLNAVSPGLTCSLPFGEHLAELAAKKL